MYLFNRSGRFIAQIGRVGQEPDEYLEYLAEFLNIDEINKKVIIYTSNPNRLMYFDFNDKFVQFVPVNEKDGGLKIWINNHILSMYAVQFLPDFTYKVYDSNFQPIVNRIRPLRLNRSNERLFNIPGNPFSHYLFNDQVYIREFVLNDILYMIDHKNFLFIPKYIISEGKYSFTSDYGGLDFWPLKNNELIGFYDAYLFKENVDKLKPKGIQEIIDKFKKNE